MRVNRDEDTICALSTPAGHGGISVIRVSGSKAYDIVKKLAPRLPLQLETHHSYYSPLIDAEGAHFDEVVLTYFQEGRSFTGEHTIEISCHGNPLIVDEALRLLVLNGSRPADRGEFTYRAYINGRIDLIQAESVLVLIESQSKAASRIALGQLKGRLSSGIYKIEERLVWCLAHLEASIDFSAEDIDVVDNKVVRTTCVELLEVVRNLNESFEKGQVIRHGIKIALLGRPNVGKSSLLNALLNEDKAIVTDVPGTTRDVVEGQLLLGGLNVSVLDTAGLRETGDFIEAEGIRRSRAAMADSNLVIFVLSAIDGLTDSDIEELAKIPAEKLLVVWNKIDAGAVSGIALVQEPIKVSCKTKEGIGSVLNFIKGFNRKNAIEDSSVLFHARHFECLKKVQMCLERADKALGLNYSPELIALEFQEALVSIFEILGKKVDEEILDRIFKEFCLGK